MCRSCKRSKEEHPPLVDHSGGMMPSTNLVQSPAQGPGASPLNSSMDSNTKSMESSSTTNAGSSSAGTNSASGTGSGSDSVPMRQVAHGQSDDDSGCALEEYTWVPPGLKPDQVSQTYKISHSWYAFKYRAQRNEWPKKNLEINVAH